MLHYEPGRPPGRAAPGTGQDQGAGGGSGIAGAFKFKLKTQAGKFQFVAIAQAVFLARGQLKAIDARAVGAVQVFHIQQAIHQAKGSMNARHAKMIGSKRGQVKIDIVFAFQHPPHHRPIIDGDDDGLITDLQPQPPGRREHGGIGRRLTGFHR